MTHHAFLLAALATGALTCTTLAACGPGDGCEVTLTCESGDGDPSGTGGSGPGGSGPGGNGATGGSGGSGGSTTCGNGTVNAGEVCFGQVEVYDTGPSSPVGDSGSDVALLDCDDDGDLDVVAEHGSRLMALRNDGSGTLTELNTYDFLPTSASGVTTGDVDAAAGTEVVVTYDGGGYTDRYSVTNCAFELLSVVYHSGSAGSAAAATTLDINGSGLTDHVTIVDNTLAYVFDGGSTPVEIGSSASTSTAIVSASLNADDFTDVAYTDVTANRIRWATGDGTSLNNAPGYYEDVGSTPRNLSAGDVNGDGDTDLIVVNSAANSIAVLKNTSGATVSFSKVLDDVSVDGANGVHAAQPTDIALGDVDGDGDLDAMTANTDDSANQSSVTLLLNDGEGNFAIAAGFPLEVPRRPTGVALADLNGDGALDVVTTHDFDDGGTTHVAVALANP